MDCEGGDGAEDAAASEGVEQCSECEMGEDEAEGEEESGSAEAGAWADPASDEEEEADGAGDFEFVFDNNGARVRPEEEAAREAAAAAAAEAWARGSAATEPEPKRRKTRTVTILQQAAGQEDTSEGQLREEAQKKRRGIFTAASYKWLIYAPAHTHAGATQPKIVPLDTVAKVGECHATLDAAANVDADQVLWSNSIYEMAGIDATQPEMLFAKAFTCACKPCRGPNAVRVSYRDCPFLTQTGRWRQLTVQAIGSVSRVAAEKREKEGDFAKSTKAEQLYAVFSSFAERGGRAYWLLRCKKPGYQAPSGLKQQDGTAIRKNTWVIDAHWYASTSDDQSRRSYKLLDKETPNVKSLVHVPVKSLVQEKELEFERSGAREGNESLLGDACHNSIMRWNFSNVV